MYALAASAAGVSMLALAQSATARIIYTPAHRDIGPNSTAHLDIDHDRKVDFSFRDVKTTFGGELLVAPAHQGNQIWGHSVFSTRSYASALLAGMRIRPANHFLHDAGIMASTFVSSGRPLSSGVCRGPWANVSKRYLGFKFVIQGETHFGWARLDVSCPYYSGTVTATLTGYAYETVPDRTIVTGKKAGPQPVDAAERGRSTVDSAALRPGTLARLAQGTEGLRVRRKQEQQEGGR